jgi:4-amino-4-deoxy-L-arabinose transferase-like glycosyltransferase
MPQPEQPPDHAAAVSNLPFPRTFAACLPFLWTRILFPGAPPTATRVRWQALLFLLILPGTLLYPCLSFYLFEPDEARYAEIPREMLQRGDLVVPYLQGEPYLDKPPLLYWMVMGCYQVFGVHDWAARVVPALAVHGCILVVYLLGRRSLGERAAFWAAFLLSLAPGFVSMGRLLVLDGLLALWVTLSILGAFEAQKGAQLRWGWWFLSALACGLGVLTKGPVALLLLIPPLWVHRRLTKAIPVISWKARLVFLAAVMAVALPWYGGICLRLPHFAYHFLWEHNFVRFLAPFDHLEPFWYYLPVLLGGLLPATLWAIPLLRYLFAGSPAVAGRRCPELGFMLLAGGWCVLFFSLSGCKLPTYVLPAFPLLTLAAGYFIATTSWQKSRRLQAGLGLAYVVLVLAHHVAVPWYAWYRSPMGNSQEVSRYCADPGTPVICFPRSCDSVGFYLRRDDLKCFRSKEIDSLRAALRAKPRTVVLCTHRHSLGGLREALPPELWLHDEKRFKLEDIPGVPERLMEKIIKVAGETPWGLCDVAVVERRRQ